jgi:hypothetical protein
MNDAVTIRVVGVFSLLFWLVPLHAQTQAEISAQARSDFAKVDVDLNKTDQALLVKLPATELEGSSTAGTVRYQRTTDLTRKRITELKAMIENGSASGPQPDASQSENKQASSVSQSEANPISPDKKWQYKPATDNHGPQIVKAGTTDSTGDLSDDCDIGSCGDNATVLWAPDSHRFVFHWGQGRTHHSSFYQLRDDHWESLKPPPEDELSQRLHNDIAAQLKRKGRSEEKLEKKELYLRFLWQDVKVDQWIDSNTALVYAGEHSVIARKNEPSEMFDGFGADFLFTLKFDGAGNWKIVKTRRLSDKEVEKRARDQ